MAYDIVCPYCFCKDVNGKPMKDDEVMFRSERVNKGTSPDLPAQFVTIQDFIANFPDGANKEDILKKLQEWDFFKEEVHPDYSKFWNDFGQTTEANPYDQRIEVEAYKRKVIDPSDPAHQRYLKQQPDGGYLIRDKQGMVSQIQLSTGEKCSRRVCRYCKNPLPDNYGKSPVKYVAIVGITSSGKTVYLSQLFRKMSFYASQCGLSAGVTTASAQVFLENNVVEVGAPLPAGTPSKQFQQPLFYDLRRRISENRLITETIVFYDVAGEVFQRGTDEVKNFAPFIRNADGIIFLIDPSQVTAFVAAMQDAHVAAEPNRVLEAIHGEISGYDTEELCDTPIAICIPKMDKPEVRAALPDELWNSLQVDYEAVLGDDGWALPQFNSKKYNPIAQQLNRFFRAAAGDMVRAFVHDINTDFTQYNYFAFTALGCGTTKQTDENGVEFETPIGPMLKPKRIEEPLLWLFNRFGYISENQPITNPASSIKCPNPACGREGFAEKLPPDQQERVIRKFPRKTAHYDYRCRLCGCEFPKQ